MKIVVCVKRVIDYSVQIRVQPDKKGVETAHVKMAMNPFDEIALEEALRLKEKGLAEEIVAVSIGPLSCQETLRSALARGADRAILVETTSDLEPLITATILKKMIEKESPQLVILGKQAIDTDHNQTGQMLAGLLSWPQGTFVSKIMIQENFAEVTREIDGGLETLKLTLPAVITTDLRLNEPRYISLPQIVQAKRKPLVTILLQALEVNCQPRLEIVSVEIPEKRKMGIAVHSAAELVDKLKHEHQVIS